MDITVIIPSRGRVTGLHLIMRSMNFLESGKHRVHYGVACDDDDVGTIVACQEIQKEILTGYRVGPRQCSLGGLINDMAVRMPADVYVGVNDDVLCLEPDWDDKIAQAVKKKPYGVFWWTNALPQEVLFPIVTEKWRTAAGSIFTDHYPFWYDDLCLMETWCMTTDEAPQVLGIKIADRTKTITHRMRELKFWQKFYTETRVLRVKNSLMISEKLGLPEPKSIHKMAQKLTEHLLTVPDEKLTEIERNQGETTPPDEAYLIAKARAQSILDEIREAA